MATALTVMVNGVARKATPEEAALIRARVPTPEGAGAIVRRTHVRFFRAALREIGKFADMEAAMEARSNEAYDLWHYEPNLPTNDADLVAVATSLNIDLPALFDRADALRAARG